MAGMDKSKVMKRGGMKTKVKKMGRGKKTSMQGGVENYQDYVKRMFGGGMTRPKPKSKPRKIKKPIFTPTKADDRGL